MGLSDDSFAGIAADTEAQAQTNLRLITRVYPELANPKKPECVELLARAPIQSFPAGALLVQAREMCCHFVLLLEGSLRIYQIAEDGREVTLYRIRPGDICLMSLNSLLNNKPFNASARAETGVRALILKQADFHRAMAISDNFRNLVLKSLTASASELTNSFYELAFQRLDMRLACLLGQLFERAGGEAIKVTHQTLAQELGTTREVVSRLLKQFEQQGCITLARGRISLNSQSSLRLLLREG